MTIDQLLTEARAKIIWGEPPDSVREFLLAKDIPAPVADATIADAQQERHAEIRRIGVKWMLKGALLAAAAGTALGWILNWTLPHSGHGARVYGFGGRGVMGGTVMLGIITLYGLWKLLRGLIYYLRPQSEPKSITEIEE